MWTEQTCECWMTHMTVRRKYVIIETCNCWNEACDCWMKYAIIEINIQSGYAVFKWNMQLKKMKQYDYWRKICNYRKETYDCWSKNYDYQN